MKKINLILTVLVIVLIFVIGLKPNEVFAETSELNYVDLKNWTRLGDGIWNVEEGGRTVRQTINGKQTFFLSDNVYKNRIIKGTIKVDTDDDDDMVGFVMGYQDPISNIYNFILIDWKQLNQDPITGGYKAYEGYTIGKFNGELANIMGTYTQYFWEHSTADGKYQSFATNYGSDKGWDDFTEYQFSILYTEDRIKLMIDNKEIFDIEDGNFDEGRFGFYNYSQAQVIYGNVQSASGISGSAAPVAQDDKYGMTMGTELETDRFNGILFNDYDPNLDNYSAELVTDVSHGTLSLVTTTGGFTYVPDSDYYGMDSFTYKLRDAEDRISDTVKVEINIISGANVKPEAVGITNKWDDLSWTDGTTVATLSTTDPNSGDFHDYMLTDNAGARFGITDNRIIINNSSLVVPGESYNITVRSTDFQGLYLDETFTIKVPYTVTFKDYNGDVIDNELVLNIDDAFNRSGTTRKGYTFTEWDGSITDIYNIFLTAQYTANNYTVTYEPEGGTVNPASYKGFRSYTVCQMGRYRVQHYI